MATTGATEVALAEYKEIAAQFRELTNIRFKLLTYLPAGAAALATLLSKETAPGLTPTVAAFGFVVTLSLGTYNVRNDQHYDELVARAAQIEREHLNLPHGIFANRPQSWLKFGKKRRWVIGKPSAENAWILETRLVSVEHRWPIGLIYAATCALWVGIFVRATLGHLTSPVVESEAQLAAILVVFWVWIRLRAARDRRQKHIRHNVVAIVTDSANWQAADDGTICEEFGRVIGAQENLFGIDAADAKARINRMLKQPYDLSDFHDRSLLLAAVIDLPARWIEDVSTGRR